MHRACRLIVIGFAILYLLAIGLFIVGTFGLFGSPSGPLAGIYPVSYTHLTLPTSDLV